MDIPKAVEDLAWPLEGLLTRDCWEVEVGGFEDDDDTYFGCLCLNSLTERGVFGVFSRLELYLCPVEELDDAEVVQPRFIFYAEPDATQRIFGPDNGALGRALERDEFQTLKTFATRLLEKAGLRAGECNVEVTSPGSFVEFKDGHAKTPYEVEVLFGPLRASHTLM